MARLPYQDIASSLGITEEDVLLAFNELADEQFISRIGRANWFSSHNEVPR